MSSFDHAVLCLMWSETDQDGNPLDSLDVDLTPQAERQLMSEWETFTEQAERLGFDPEEHAAQMLHPDCEGDPWAAVAHDWILTRNGHGTGFWDAGRWTDQWGQLLTQLCRQQGEIYTAVDSEAGKVHIN